MKKLIMLLLAALPLVAVAQTELTPEQELEKAQKELEAAQRKLTEARERAQKAQQTQGKLLERKKMRDGRCHRVRRLLPRSRILQRSARRPNRRRRRTWLPYLSS